LATKFHTEPTDGTGSSEGIRLNPIMKHLMINGYTYEYHMQVVKRKRSKRQKTKVKAEVVESVGENQPTWLDTLKEEIVNLK
jgi:hypothetical protein